eukprot:g52823.t1
MAFLKSLAFLLLSTCCHSTCISGNCENGKGIFETAMNFKGAVLLGHSDKSRYEKFTSSKTADFVSGFQESICNYGTQFDLLARIDGFVSSRYEGDFQLGQRHGQGKEVDRRSGRGVFVWPEQAQRYEGDWLEDVPGWGTRHRKDGTLYYIGQYRFGWEEGTGTLTDLAGQSYQGEWLQGKKSGCGRLFTHGTEVGYVGEWQSDMKHGFGVQRWRDGSVYQGEYANDLLNGIGVYNMSDDSRYEGEWKDNRKHGWGSFFYASGGQYEGQWKDDEQDGYGKSTDSEGQVYGGEFKDGLANGYGVYLFHGYRYAATGRMICGMGKVCLRRFQLNPRAGNPIRASSPKQIRGSVRGRSTPRLWRANLRFWSPSPSRPLGSRYEGMFREGKKHGGKYQYPHGGKYSIIKYEGMWASGHQNGYGVFTFRDGIVYAGEWKHDNPACKLDFFFKVYVQKSKNLWKSALQPYSPTPSLRQSTQNKRTSSTSDSGSSWLYYSW